MSRIATFVAATTEEIHQTWRDYVRFLEAQQALLDQSDETDAAFEHDDAHADGATQARAILAAIPAARRVVFDTVLEQERQRALIAAEAEHQAAGGRGPLDPQAVERAVLEQLHDEAHGIGTPTLGRGLVPISPEESDWYEVDVAALEDAPQAAAYLLRGVDGDERRRGFIQAGIVGGVTVVALLVWLLWPSDDTLVVVDASVAPAVGDVVVEPWSLRQLVITSATTTTTLAVSTTTVTAWPVLPSDDTPLAYWHAPVLLPLRICVPATLLEGATTVELGGEGAQPIRHYTLSTARPTQMDLVLTPCEDSTLPVRFGTLTEVVSLPEQQFGTESAMGNTPLTVRSISVVGLGDDPTLPADRERVELVVHTTQPLDWAAFAPTLLLADGQTLMPSAIDATTDGAILRYLVPTSDQPRPVLWQLTPLEGETVLRWRATLPVPPNRLAILRDRLAVERAEITSQDDKTVALALTLRNGSAASLPLTPADLSLTRDEQPIPLPDLAALATPLAAQEQRTLTITLPRPSTAEALILTLGPYRFALGDGEEVMTIDE
jgi:hypothetical protein